MALTGGLKITRLIRNKKKVAAVGTAISAIVAIIIISSVLMMPQSRSSPAPNFTLVDTQGTAFSLSDFKGKVVVIDFMATWCAPCKEEMKHLRNIHEEYNNKVIIISISVSPQFDNDEMLNQFMEENNATWRAAIGTLDLVRDYKVFLIPKLVMIDQEGRIRFENTGVTDERTLSKELDKILNY